MPSESVPLRRRSNAQQAFRKRARASSLSPSVARRKRRTSMILFDSDSSNSSESEEKTNVESKQETKNSRSDQNGDSEQAVILVIDSSSEEESDESPPKPLAARKPSSLNVNSVTTRTKRRVAAKSCLRRSATKKAKTSPATSTTSALNNVASMPTTKDASNTGKSSPPKKSAPTTLSQKSRTTAPSSPGKKKRPGAQSSSPQDRPLNTKQSSNASASGKPTKTARVAKAPSLYTPPPKNSSRKSSGTLSFSRSVASPRGQSPLLCHKSDESCSKSPEQAQHNANVVQDTVGSFLLTETTRAANMTGLGTGHHSVKGTPKKGEAKSPIQNRGRTPGSYSVFSPKRGDTKSRVEARSVPSLSVSKASPATTSTLEKPPRKRVRCSLKPPCSTRKSPQAMKSMTDDCDESVATCEMLTTHCWTCHSSLDTNDKDCFYAMHAHPVLEVPTCSCCSEISYDVEARIMSDEEVECCVGCGRGDDGDSVMLLLCDSCPRSFCLTCVAQAHGGGHKGTQAASRLANNDFEYQCLRCSAPAGLRMLQQALVQAGNSENDDEQVSLETMKEELLSAEEELERCDAMDNEEFRLSKRIEVYNELADKCSDEDELEELVNDEMDILESQWRDHHRRVADHVTTLQEKFEARLKRENGMSLLDFYKSLPQDQKEIQDEVWRNKADAEMDKKYKEADKNWQKYCIPGNYTGTEQEIYDKDEPGEAGEIEDIQDVEECMSAVKEKDEIYNQWSKMRNENYESRMKSLKTALRFEDMLLEENDVMVTRRNDGDDEAELEDDQRSSVAAGGRVRRDELLLKRTSAAAKRRSNRTGVGPSKVEQKAGIAERKNEKREKKRVVPQPVSPAKSTVSATETVNFAGSGGGHGVFDNSDLILTPAGAERAVSVAASLVKSLKQHQIDGIKFMWKNAFCDLANNISDDTGEDPNCCEDKGVGGCILAHNMGLGKSLQVIALLHALFHHPSLSDRHSATQEFRTALLVVPAITLANWEIEFDTWLRDVLPPIHVFNLNSVERASRPRTIKDWSTKGGVLLLTDGLFLSGVKSQREDMAKALQSPGPDIVILDEAHSMITNNTSVTYKGLKAIETKRRIALTGTPLQNNLMEYFHMASWVRPGCLGTESSFEREFVQPINYGMASDSSQAAVQKQRQKSRELYALLSPFVHRRDCTVLKDSLPFMQQAVIHVRQTKLQTTLFRAFNRYKKKNNLVLGAYQLIRPVHNHPGCLLMRRSDELAQGMRPPGGARKKKTNMLQGDVKASKISNQEPQLTAEGTRQNNLSSGVVDLVSESEDELVVDGGASSLGNTERSDRENDENDSSEGAKLRSMSSVSVERTLDHDRTDEVENRSPKWWERIASKNGEKIMKDLASGYKFELLLRILGHADQLGDKVVVFSNCLKTLDFIEEVLNSHWESFGKVRGPWRKNSEYFRIDGAVSAGERGNLVSIFNGGDTTSVDRSKVFLMSIKAGGVGINLTAANRVVLFDSHWNPAVMSQALYRCYRYGQTKPVFAYRFITEGSMEEKIYSRSVNKSSLAARVIDQLHPERSFTEKELDLVSKNDLWVCCDNCDRWRMLPPDTSEAAEENLPQQWYCRMNPDKEHATCDAEERSKEWYAAYYARTLAGADNDSTPVSLDTPAYHMPDEAKAEFVKRDEILCQLVGAAPLATDGEKDKKKGKGQRSMIAKCYFYDTLLEDRGAELEEEEISTRRTHDDGALKEVTKDSPDVTTAESGDGLQSPGEPTASRVQGVHESNESTNSDVAESLDSCIGAENENMAGANENCDEQPVPTSTVTTVSSPSRQSRRASMKIPKVSATKASDAGSSPTSASFHLSTVRSSEVDSSSDIEEQEESCTEPTAIADAKALPLGNSNLGERGRSEDDAIEILSDSEAE